VPVSPEVRWGAEFRQGDAIIEEGVIRDDPNFYILESGEAKATKRESGGIEVCARLLTISGKFLSCTTPLVRPQLPPLRRRSVLELNRHAFNRLVGPFRDILMRNMHTYLEFEKAIVKNSAKYLSPPPPPLCPFKELPRGTVRYRHLLASPSTPMDTTWQHSIMRVQWIGKLGTSTGCDN
jgi:hypothetical protein